MMAVLSVLVVAVGGAVGALVRWGLSLAAQRPAGGDERAQARGPVRVPWWTFAANMLACLLLGIVAITSTGPAGAGGQLAFLLLGTGVAGALSTMSAFASEMVALMRRGASVVALGYALLSLGGGMFSLWLGLVIGS